MTRLMSHRNRHRKKENLAPRAGRPLLKEIATHVIGATQWKKKITWQGTSLEFSFDLFHVELKQEPGFAHTDMPLRRERTTFDGDKGFSNAETPQKKQRKASAFSAFASK